VVTTTDGRWVEVILSPARPRWFNTGNLCYCPKHRHPVLGEWRTPGAKRPKLGGVCCVKEARAPEIRRGYFWSQVRWNRSSTSCPIPVRTRSQSRGTLVILRRQSPVFSTGNRGFLIQLDCGNYGAPLRWKGSSETFLEHQTACFYHICSKSSVTVNLSGFVVIFGLQVL
jgi:hypothetical protein